MAVFEVQAARTLAASLLDRSGDRWLHTQTAAAAATEAAAIVDPEDRALLVAAAWLHDIGYLHPHPPTGYHPLDGAYLLSDRGWPRRLVSLVAHHSEARFAATARGLDEEMAEFDREEGPVADALIYADMTAGPTGQRVRLDQRLADARRRHAGESGSLRAARILREPHLILAAARTDVRLSRLAGHHHWALLAEPTADLASTFLELTRAHPKRDERDVHAAIHAALSHPHLDVPDDEPSLCAHDLLVATEPTRPDSAGRRWHLGHTAR